MKAQIKKEILNDLKAALAILEKKDGFDRDQLEKLSDHAIEDVALYKDLDVISVTVLIYSLYKVANCLQQADYEDLYTELSGARKSLERNFYGRYNKHIKTAFTIVRRCDSAVKNHLHDVMHAARMKKGSTLLQKGLSLGQAAGLMGLSNWDLQQYAAKTTLLDEDHEAVLARDRLRAGIRLFEKKNVVLFFDAGPIITLVLSNMAWLLPKLKEYASATFYITPAVHRELVERAFSTKRFAYEAIQVLRMLKDGVLQLYEKVPKTKLRALDTSANSSFSSRKRKLDILQAGELESLASSLQSKADAIIMDERTLRLLIEDSNALVSLLERRFKHKVLLHEDRLEKFKQELSTLPILRSAELVGIGYTLGMFDHFVPDMKQGKKVLVDALLWSVKGHGCAITEHELEELKKELV